MAEILVPDSSLVTKVLPSPNLGERTLSCSFSADTARGLPEYSWRSPSSCAGRPADLAAANEDGGLGNGDASTAYIKLNGQNIAVQSFGGGIGGTQIIRTNVFASFSVLENQWTDVR